MGSGRAKRDRPNEVRPIPLPPWIEELDGDGMRTHGGLRRRTQRGFGPSEARPAERSEAHPTPSVCLTGSCRYSGAWLSPVERCVRDAEVPGSNPGAPISTPVKAGPSR